MVVRPRYHAGLVATAVLLCAGVPGKSPRTALLGAVVERRNGPLPGMGYVSSRMSDEARSQALLDLMNQDEEDEEEKG